MLHSALTPKMLAQLQGHLDSLPTFMNSHVFFTHELWRVKLMFVFWTPGLWSLALATQVTCLLLGGRPTCPIARK